MLKKSPFLEMFRSGLALIWERFDLSDDKAHEADVIDSIEKGIELKGTNLWVLIFAIFIASIGLNVNSNAVIVGAMLISPLMGPIMGVGLGVGIYDLDLIKKALKSLGFAVGVSILASTLYFLVSPLSEAQSELLARTQATIWDVMVAFLGGLAGMIAATRKNKGNVVPGVAIATTLMPPLCTAGYSIARGNLYFFLSSFYLFFINSVFICLATYLIVRLLNFKQKMFLDKRVEIRVRRYVMAFVVLTVIPSIFLAYRIVRRSIIENNFNHFIQNEVDFSQAQLINKELRIFGSEMEIDLLLIGDPLIPEQIQQLRKKLAVYGLEKAKLNVRQGGGKTSQEDLVALKTGILEDLFQKNEKIIQSKDEMIRMLEQSLVQYDRERLPTQDILAELKAQNNKVTQMSIARVFPVDSEGRNNKQGLLDGEEQRGSVPVLLVSIHFSSPPGRLELKRIQDWLAVRTKTSSVKIIVEFGKDIGKSKVHF